MHRSRLLPPAALALTTLAGLAACVDAPTGPQVGAAAPARLVGSTSVTTVSGGSTGSSSSTVVSSSGSGGGSGTVSVLVGPNTTVTMTIGSHRLTIPAGAICDPATSSYGAAYWNAPCATAKAGVTITARYFTTSDGRPQVEFSPALRFVPTKTVTLYLLDRTAVATAGSTIRFCPTGSTTCVDESIADASLATKVDPATGYVFRRVKHFSGYVVGIGRSAE